MRRFVTPSVALLLLFTACGAPVGDGGDPAGDPPETLLLEAPAGRTEARSATFAFASEPAGLAFECDHQQVGFAPCESPVTLTDLAPGRHAFAVRAVDASGRPDPTPAAVLWEVAPPDESTVPLRIVAANLTSGNYQAYEAPGIRLLQGLDPDVALLQEFNYAENTAADLQAFVDAAFGPAFDWYREPGAQIPNGIVSRHPILEAGIWEDPESPNREWAWARIDVPGPVDLWAVSLHLLTRDAGTRAAEARGLLAHLEALPAGDLLVVGGDLNTDHTGEAALSVLHGVVDADGPWPVDQDGVAGTNASRSKPYDHVLVDDDLGAFLVPVQVGESGFSDGLVFDSRVFEPLDAVAPVRPGDSDVPGMQHMAVVKDFRLPE